MRLDRGTAGHPSPLTRRSLAWRLCGMNIHRLAILGGCLVWASVHAAPGLPGGASAQTNSPAHQFENNVLQYEASDKSNAPPRNAILLVGDSQFYRWKTLAEDLPGYNVINRGIDSFQMSDLLYFADRLVLPYQARLIVLHVGANDVHGGKSPAPPQSPARDQNARHAPRQPAVRCHRFKIGAGEN